MKSDLKNVEPLRRNSTKSDSKRRDLIGGSDKRNFLIGWRHWPGYLRWPGFGSALYPAQSYWGQPINWGQEFLIKVCFLCLNPHISTLRSPHLSVRFSQSVVDFVAHVCVSQCGQFGNEISGHCREITLGAKTRARGQNPGQSLTTTTAFSLLKLSFCRLSFSPTESPIVNLSAPQGFLMPRDKKESEISRRNFRVTEKLQKSDLPHFSCLRGVSRSRQRRMGTPI